MRRLLAHGTFMVGWPMSETLRNTHTLNINNMRCLQSDDGVLRRFTVTSRETDGLTFLMSREVGRTRRALRY